MIEYPDPDDLLTFKLVITPDEVSSVGAVWECVCGVCVGEGGGSGIRREGRKEEERERGGREGGNDVGTVNKGWWWLGGCVDREG